MTEREALKLALEALDGWRKGFPDHWGDIDEKAVDYIKEVLAQPERKPLTDEQRNWIVATCPTPRHIIDTVEKMHAIKE